MARSATFSENPPETSGTRRKLWCESDGTEGLIRGGFGRLPVHHLPLAFAFDERAAVQILRDFSLAILLRRGHEPKRDDCGVPVLLNANVLRRVSCLWVAGFRRRSRTHVLHDFRFTAPPAA